MTEWVNEFSDGSDRARAIVGGAVLDESLSVLLRGVFVDNPENANSLLKPEGPIGPFATRLRVAFALGLLSQNDLHDLKLMGNIRNRFAHSHVATRFEDELIRSLCATLKFPQEVAVAHPGVPVDSRLRFAITLGYYANHLRDLGRSLRTKRRIVPDNIPFHPRPSG